MGSVQFHGKVVFPSLARENHLALELDASIKI
jgi:hypothetical protein